LPLIVNRCRGKNMPKESPKTSPKGGAPRYSMPNVRLYRWQEECLARWFENGCRGIVRVATGAGKTLLALAAAYHLAARNPAMPIRIKIVVPKVFLAMQWRADIMEFLGAPRRDIGLFCGAIKEASEKPFMVYVLNTARAFVSRHIMNDVGEGSSVLLICDECHHFGSAENAHVFDFLPRIPQERYFALGLSATPDSENCQETIVPAIGGEIYRYDLPDAARDQIVAGCALFYIAVDFAPDERDAYDELSEKISAILGRLLQSCPELKGATHGAFFQRLLRLRARDDGQGALARALLASYYSRKEVVHKARMRIGCGMEIIRRLMPDHRTILFAERIETADILFAMLREAFPGRIDRYHSLMGAEEKARALSRYRTGESKVIVCCRALDEGLNVPETDAGVILSVGSGMRQRIQRVGRILRRGGDGRLKKIYYLHVSGSAEAEELLPSGYAAQGGQDEAGAYRLGYSEHGGLLPDSAYKSAADEVMAGLLRSGASDRHLRSAERQLGRGAVRTDFLLPETDCAKNLERARGEERDYWAAMLLMARVREGSPPKPAGGGMET
jgi:superfamily II DNA or RNA helicase